MNILKECLIVVVDTVQWLTVAQSQAKKVSLSLSALAARVGFEFEFQKRQNPTTKTKPPKKGGTKSSQAALPQRALQRDSHSHMDTLGESKEKESALYWKWNWRTVSGKGAQPSVYVITEMADEWEREWVRRSTRRRPRQCSAVAAAEAEAATAAAAEAVTV